MKVHGYRIELGEIESELELKSGVAGAVVLAHKQKLISYVTLVGNKGKRLDESCLKAILRELFIATLYDNLEDIY